MAKQPQRSRPTAQPTAAAAPYPKDWARMSKDQRGAWLKTNRPGRPTGVPRPTVPPPPPPPQPMRAAPGGAHQSSDQQQHLVCVEVSMYTVTVGDREPVPCDAAELQQVIDSEVSAYYGENPPEEGYPDEDDTGVSTG